MMISMIFVANYQKHRLKMCNYLYSKRYLYMQYNKLKISKSIVYFLYVWLIFYEFDIKWLCCCMQNKYIALILNWVLNIIYLLNYYSHIGIFPNFIFLGNILAMIIFYLKGISILLSKRLCHDFLKTALKFIQI